MDRSQTSRPQATRSSRRRFLGGAAGLALTAAAPAALAQTPSASGWSFTDDKGVTATLAETPVRIAADINAAAPLCDMGIRPVAVFGWNATDTGDFGAAGGRIDPNAVEVVGNATTPLEVEKLVAVQPDLIVTLTWAPDDPQDYWSIDPKILEQARKVAPIVAISATQRADMAVERFHELALSIDPDAAASEPAEDKAAYEDASARLQALTAEKNDIAFSFIWAGQDVLYVAVPEAWGDLALFQHLGVRIISPESPSMVFWDELSWEQALKYPSDVVMNSWRSDIEDDALKDLPTFAQHPAIKAGQIGPWNQDFIMSYKGLAESMESVIAALEPALKVMG